MPTTSIEVDPETYAKPPKLSEEAGATLADTLSDAAEALRRQRFGRTVAKEFEDLRKDPEAWADYLAEAEATHVSDGID